MISDLNIILRKINIDFYTKNRFFIFIIICDPRVENSCRRRRTCGVRLSSLSVGLYNIMQSAAHVIKQYVYVHIVLLLLYTQ